MKRNTLIIVLVLATVLVACQPEEPVARDMMASSSAERSVTEISDRQMIPVKIGDHLLTVEAVIEAPSIIKGLGDRETIGSDGMLFVLPSKEVQRFWMKGMQFDLDMIWIADDRVAHITSNVPPVEDPDDPNQPTYSSEVPVNYVLEVPAGTAEELKIEVGDEVVILP